MDKDIKDRLEYMEGRSIGLNVALALTIHTLDNKQRLRDAVNAAVRAEARRLDPESPRLRGIQDVAETITNPGSATQS